MLLAVNRHSLVTFMRMPMSKTRNIDAIELALATYYYASTSHYDDDLRELRKAVGQIPDLGKKGSSGIQMGEKAEFLRLLGIRSSPPR